MAVVVDGETFYSGMEVVELLEATDENCVAFRKWESGEGFWGRGRIQGCVMCMWRLEIARAQV